MGGFVLVEGEELVWQEEREDMAAEWNINATARASIQPNTPAASVKDASYKSDLYLEAQLPQRQLHRRSL